MLIDMDNQVLSPRSGIVQTLANLSALNTNVFMSQMSLDVSSEQGIPRQLSECDSHERFARYPSRTLGTYCPT